MRISYKFCNAALESSISRPLFLGMQRKGMVINMKNIDFGRMSVIDLNMCVYIARYNSISKAAKDLHISQSALSRRLQVLEDMLGTKLFVRGKSTSVVLTPAGRAFCKEAEKIVDQIGAAVYQTAEYGLSSESLVISTVPSIRPEAVITPFAKIYQQRHPGRVVRIQCNNPSMAGEQFKNGSLNLYFILTQMSYFFNSDEYDIIPARSSEVYIGMLKDNNKFPGNNISVQELRDASFVTSTRKSHIDQLNKVCGDAGFSPNIVFQTRNPASIITCINGDEVFLTDQCSYNYQPDLMKYCKIEDYRINYSFIISKTDPAINKKEVMLILDKFFSSI